MKSLFLLAPALMLATTSGTVAAQQRGTTAQQSENARSVADLRTLLDATDARITEGQRERKVVRARATTLHAQVAQARTGMTRLARRQGFVSAAELASYNRMMATIGAELDRSGVARSYGNDALLSAEGVAFQKADARLRYRDARMEYDAKNCAVYEGTARNGRVRRVPLLSPSGKPICVRR